MAALRKGHSHVRERKGVLVTEVVEGVTRVSVKDADEKKIGTATHVHYRVEWPDGSVTHGTASEKRFRKRAEG